MNYFRIIHVDEDDIIFGEYALISMSIKEKKYVHIRYNILLKYIERYSFFKENNETCEKEYHFHPNISICHIKKEMFLSHFFFP
jgi:hypothetical protein